jgi:Chromo (CHRromatin Organisation MOdifier) domain
MEQVHPVFHTSLLRPDPSDPLPRQHSVPQGPVQVQNDASDATKGTHEEWEVEQVLDSRYSYGFLEYKVKWKGYPIEKRKWYRAELFQNAPDICNAFHQDYPNKPRPRPEGLRLLQSELDDRVNKRNAAREQSLRARRTSPRLVDSSQEAHGINLISQELVSLKGGVMLRS